MTKACLIMMPESQNTGPYDVNIYVHVIFADILLLTIFTLISIVSELGILFNFQFGQNGKEEITVADLMRHEVKFDSKFYWL